MDDPVTDVSLTEIAGLIAERKVSSVEVTTACVERIQAYAGRLGCVAGFDAEASLAKTLPIADTALASSEWFAGDSFSFGDIVLGTADQFLRADSTIARVEGVRSGSAIAFASNSPGGVVNFISKTGEEEGGSEGAGRRLGGHGQLQDRRWRRASAAPPVVPRWVA